MQCSKDIILILLPLREILEGIELVEVVTNRLGHTKYGNR